MLRSLHWQATRTYSLVKPFIVAEMSLKGSAKCHSSSDFLSETGRVGYTYFQTKIAEMVPLHPVTDFKVIILCNVKTRRKWYSISVSYLVPDDRTINTYLIISWSIHIQTRPQHTKKDTKQTTRARTTGQQPANCCFCCRDSGPVSK